MGKVVFVSKGAGFRAVTRTASRTVIDNEVMTRAEEVVDFSPHGRVELDEEQDAAAIEHLRGLESFNREFFELGAEPDREDPSVDEQFERILDMATEFDHRGINELLRAERASYNRPTVLKAGDAALKRVQAALEEAAGGAEGEPDGSSSEDAEDAAGGLSGALEGAAASE